MTTTRQQVETILRLAFQGSCFSLAMEYEGVTVVIEAETQSLLKPRLIFEARMMLQQIRARS
jgi:hypothetical protein